MKKKKSVNLSKAKAAFRRDIAQGKDPISTLSDLRKKNSIGEYSDSISNFQLFGHFAAKSLFRLGPNTPNKLVVNNFPLEPLSLFNELHWSVYWLSNQSEKLNLYLATRSKLQSLILDSQFKEAIFILDNFIEENGWSLWAVELRCILEQKTNGMEGLAKWLEPLQKSSINTLNELLYEVFSDRCDETFSFYAFYSKCKNSFPRLSNSPPWVIPYLEYHAVGEVKKSREDLPKILSREITSSLIDYYEILIDTLVCIAHEEGFEDLKKTAYYVINKFLSYGIDDHRLDKMKFLFSDINDINLEIYNGNNSDQDLIKSLCFSKNENENENELSSLIIKLINECKELGNTAQNEIEQLIKIGISFKNLDFGQAVMNAVCHFINNSIKFRLPVNILICNKGFKIEDITYYPFLIGVEILKKNFSDSNDPLINSLINISEDRFDDLFVTDNVLFLWVANYLYEIKQFDKLNLILNNLEKFGGFWRREVAKFRFVVSNDNNQTLDAIDLINEWLIINSRYINEFEVVKLFENKKWKDFRSLDPIKVGLISHNAYQATDIASIGYICKMACRSILINGIRENINKIFEENKNSKKQVINFFSNVWVDENLSLCEKFESTENVRQERIEILQLLLQWDSENSAIYTDEIKDLTFDQTLQKGLRQIDQTRVFVNESVISRWAESELLQDYNRWLKLKDAPNGIRIIDDIIGQYSVDVRNRELLIETTNGKPNLSSALLIEIIDRLYKRFLSDPTDGLDCYLSLRIRHGSLRGTVFGPLEEERLLYLSTDLSKDEFYRRWENVIDFNKVNVNEVLILLGNFSTEIKILVDELVNDFVQILSAEKPKAAFKYVLTPESLRSFNSFLNDSPISFSSFLSTCYFIFWKLVELGLKDLNSYISNDFKQKIKQQFDDLIEKLRILNNKSSLLPIISTLQSVSTATQTQCDVISDWFRLPSHVEDEDEDFQLPDAIDIAQEATRNVYRALDAHFVHLNTPKIPLTTSALAVLTDCLFVIFENAWKHSGLGTSLEFIDIETCHDKDKNLLTFIVYSNLSCERKNVLNSAELQRLRSKYVGKLPVDLVSREGGSGFAKLARLVRFVDPLKCSAPFDFGIEDNRWFVRVTVQLYEREGRFEAYE
ncbi:hypothetical protein MCL26_17175 [Acinetobacter pittii]|uniref:hypothetical protein n=1 Tax=Acinetobacter pittii TaxID=48296 RepID=UPI001EFD575A|nr:hypothetical protein [Acinetobacter pittii]MCG9516831.1 hypothetical protein [Acinetobacter pittii]